MWGRDLREPPRWHRTCEGLKVEQEYLEKPSEVWAVHEYKVVTGCY